MENDNKPLSEEHEQIGLALGLLAAAVARNCDATSLMIDFQSQLQAATKRYGASLGIRIASVAEAAIAAEAAHQQKHRH